MFKQQRLTPEELAIVRDKGTEVPFSPNYEASAAKQGGSYLCRQCGLALFRVQAQFHSGCGWPSFDQAIAGNVLAVDDPDGYRREILCVRCCAHLGHVFEGEGFTAANVRHCVNALSLEWVASEHVLDSEECIVAGGCFWGVEYFFQQLPGILLTEVGYTGGAAENPDYDLVCTGSSHHLEAVRIVFDPLVISFEAVAKYFFEIHDPTQTTGQGPDLGEQYMSAVFYYDAGQLAILNSLILLLEQKGYKMATVCRKVQVFWQAEGYHQNYYGKVAQVPYCHGYTPRF